MTNISKLPIAEEFPVTIDLMYDGEFYAKLNHMQYAKLRFDILKECLEKKLEPKEDSGYSIVCYPYSFDDETIPTERVTVPLHNDGSCDIIPFEFFGNTTYMMSYVKLLP